MTLFAEHTTAASTTSKVAGHDAERPGGSIEAKVAILVLVGLSLSACSARLANRAFVPAQDQVVYLDHREADWTRRSYRMHIPRRSVAGPKLPVVLVLHGAFSSARGIEERSGFSRLADEEGFVAVYPNGYGFLGLLRHWNAGHCCGRAQTLGLDDVGFLDAVLDDVMTRVDVDPSRVYVVGESNGAMLAHLYAAKRSRRVAGAGAVIGTIGSGQPGVAGTIPQPELPVPMTIVHGTADRTIPFEGGVSERYPEISWISVVDGAAFWAEHNQAPSRPSVTTSGSNKIVRSDWNPPSGGAPVVLYELRDWPHTWPGPSTTSSLNVDDPLRAFDTARVLWQHLSPHRRSFDTARSASTA